MNPFPRALGLIGAVALLSGCLAPAPSARPASTTAGDDADIPDGAIVMSSRALAQYGGSLVEAMSSELTSIEVTYRPSVSRCPLISLRGPIVGGGHSNPIVFLDGTRTTGTCILSDLYVVGVERVEIYPSGQTTRPGYANHAHGLILVFTRGA